MRKGLTASQSAIYNIRTRLRKDMMNLARTHRGCPRARGCQCAIDQSLTILENAERLLFMVGLESLADPGTTRRIVNDDNSVTIEPPSLVHLVDPADGSDRELTTRDKGSSS